MLDFLKSLRIALTRILNLIEKRITLEETNQDNTNQLEFPAEKLPTRNEKILRIAQLEIGTKEIVGPANNPRVVEYHKYASKSNKVEENDDVPWCSSFLCFVIEKAGLESTNSMMARSWLKWGVSSKADPQPGDLVVYWRSHKSSWKGHCGVFLKRNKDGSIVTLGGNQRDEVNITSYSPEKVLDFRRYSLEETIDKEDEAVLYVLARAIINGKLIGQNGKMS